MYKNILIGVALEHDGKIGGSLNVAQCLLAEGGKITALHVMEPISGYVEPYLPEGHHETRRHEAQAGLAAELGGVKDVTPVVMSGNAGRVIVEFADDHDIDCIIIASHQPGLQDYLLGSTAGRVVRHARCAVHVTR
ncbi:universal stress protein [Maritalea mediterranea]|uniref:Universal stress protein n=1 Tax=Maritalea mediterranea TaxID=2909667 RepID=A0ABS9E672_9HYPH|nr:universal stress protein [Maritalea mediterranea]MCF4098366.1 universal stress protein [Maritalea mediterranea]